MTSFNLLQVGLLGLAALFIVIAVVAVLKNVPRHKGHYRTSRGGE